MRSLVNLIKKFIIDFNIIVNITFLTNFLVFLISIYYMHDILDMLDRNLVFKNYFIFIISSLASSFIVSLIIMIFLFILYLVKILFKIDKNYFIYLVFFFFNALIIIYSFIDFKLFSIMGVHISNGFILSNIFNLKMLKHDTNFDSFIIIYLLLLACLIFILSYFLHKFLFSKKNYVVKLSNRIFLIANFLFVLISMIFFTSFNPITLSFPIFKVLNIENDTIANFITKYEKNIKVNLNKKPNIIFIVSESLRTDVINKNNTPNIYNFMKNNDVIRAKYSYSGAHYTFASLFSLLYSIFAYNFEFLINNKFTNSNILNFLHKNNYKNILITASNIEYKGIKKLILGFDKYKYLNFDSQVMDEYKKQYDKLTKDNTSFFMFLFFDNTHYSYRFNPKKARYKPYLDEKALTENMLNLKKDNKEKIFNRYKNSVINLDNNFQKIINTLSEKDKKEAIIVFTGDHGEQFWEHGLYGHIGKKTYYKENILVPLFIRIPGIKKEVFLASHLDIFPTILDYISDINEKQINKLFQGKSLLGKSIKNDKFVIIYTVDGILGLGSLYLVNKHGKAVIKSLSNQLVKTNRFKGIKYLTHEDKIITDKNIIKKLDEDIKKFEKEYKKYIELKGE